MAKDEKNLKDAADDSIIKVETTLTRAEMYIEKNQKMLTIIITAVVVVIGGFLAYKNFYKAPREKEAQAQMFAAQQYFEKDSFKLALKGDGNYLGFLYIADQYGSTNAGNLANYYIGICYLKTGEFQKAIDYLEGFSSGDMYVGSIAIGAAGDAYLELGKTDDAISCYEKAAKNQDNNLTSPLYFMKAGIACESKGDYKNALEYYQLIKDKYKKSMQYNDVDKYIARAELKVK